MCVLFREQGKRPEICFLNFTVSFLLKSSVVEVLIALLQNKKCYPKIVVLIFYSLICSLYFSDTK